MLKLGLNSDGVKALNDPFKMKHITSVSLRYSKVMFEKYFSWKATINFQNGNTEGSQNFEVTDIESDDAFKEITQKLQNFINSL